MKYLIILFLTLNTAYAAKCGTETRADIAKCEVNNLISNFVDYETCSFKEDLPQTYENLVCDPLVPLSFFETKLKEWKDSAVANLVEQERIADITARLESLGVVFGPYKSVTGLREFMNECGVSHPNPAIWIKSVYDINNTTDLPCLESKKVKVDNDKADKAAKDTAKKVAKDALDAYDCSTIIEPYTKLLCESR